MSKKQYRAYYEEYRNKVTVNGELMQKIDNSTATVEERQIFYNNARRIYELTAILFGY